MRHTGLLAGLKAWALQGPTEPGLCSGAQEQPSLPNRTSLNLYWPLAGLALCVALPQTWDPGRHRNGLSPPTLVILGLDSPAGQTLLLWGIRSPVGKGSRPGDPGAQTVSFSIFLPPAAGPDPSGTRGNQTEFYPVYTEPN